MISNPSYPTYDLNADCTAQINAGTGNILKFYLIEMSLGRYRSPISIYKFFKKVFVYLSCASNYLTFTDAFDLSAEKYCNQQKAILAFESCTSQVTVTLSTRDNADSSYTGALIYYEAIPRPPDFLCSALFVSTEKPQSSSTTKASTTTTTTPRPNDYGAFRTRKCEHYL